MAEAVVNTVPNKDTTVEFIRDELRDEISTNRKQQRDAKLNRNRSTLGDVAENDVYTEEFVTSAANSLKKKSLNIQEYNKLQNALIQNENHINAFFKVNNAIQGLCRDLSGRSIQSKIAAANCCCNLALGNSKACFTLCKFLAPYLILELESKNEPLVEVCAWTIGNLVNENSKTFSILHAQHCMKSLIRLAEQCSDTLLPAVSYASLRYIHTGIDSIEKKDIIKLTKIMAVRYPAVSDIDTMWLLAMLSSKPECMKPLMKCIRAICIYLLKAIPREDESIEKFSAALRIICNIISEPTGRVACYLFKSKTETNCALLDKLLSHRYIHIRRETLWLLGNLYNHCSATVQEIVKPISSSLPSLKLAMNSLNEIT